MQKRVAVPQAYVLDRAAVRTDVLERQRGLTAQIPHLHALESPGAARRLQVVFDLRRLPGQFVRRHDEALHGRGVQRTHQRGKAEVHRHRHQQVLDQLQPARSPQHPHGAQNREHSADAEDREIGPEIRVTRPEEWAPRRVQELGNAHEVGSHGAGNEKHGCQHPDMHLGRRLHRRLRTHHDNVTTQHVEREYDQQRYQAQGLHEGHETRHRGKLEHVIADVPTENWIHLSKWSGIRELQDAEPGPRCGQADQHAEERGGREGQGPQSLRHVDTGCVLGLDVDHDRIGHDAPLREPQVAEDEREANGPRHQPHQQLHPQSLREHDGEAGCRKPPPITQQGDRRG